MPSFYSYRIAAVCDFLSYCRYVTQGLVKSHCNDVYWEVMARRRSMTLARLGFTA
jgi:Rab-3A-interacting protein